MFKRYVVFALATAGILSLFVMPSQIAHATGESYAWKDYSTIGAKSGEYSKHISTTEGDATAIDFKQSAQDPSVFTVKPSSENCSGELKIKLSETSNSSEGTLSSSGDCTLVNSLDRTVSISNGSAITSKAETDSKKMKDTFIAKECDANKNDPEYKTCTTQAEAKYTSATDTCKSENNLTERVYLANKYLDCVAKALGVDRPTDEVKTDKQEDTNTNKCTIEDVGWLMCQMMSFTAWIADKSFDLLSTFMEVDPLVEQVNGDDSKVFAAWKVFLGFANVMFIIAILFMVFSYITSWGLSNYNIKSLAPRLIIIILLVNLSFYACSIAIDFSNILGKTLRETLVDITPPATGSKYTSWTQLTSRIQSITPVDEEYNNDNSKTPDSEKGQENKSTEEDDENPTATTALLMGATIAGGAVLFANLSALIPFMASALAAMITVLVILLIRQAAIICLVVVSPLAIAMYVLPNTKQWASKWSDLFIKLLMLYPMVSLLFGASYFAAYVVQDQASENDQTFIAIFALGIQVIPLFLLPAIIKLGNGTLDRLAGVVNNPNKGPLDRIKKKAQGFREDRKNIQLGNAATGRGVFGKLNPNSARLRRKIKKDAGKGALDGLLQQSKASYYGQGDQAEIIASAAAKGIKDDKFKNAVIEEAIAEASKGAESVNINRIGATVARWANQGVTTEDAHQMAISGVGQDGNSLTEIERAAALQMAANTAESDKAHELILNSAKLNSSLRRVLVDSLRKNGFSKSNAHFGGSAMNKVLEGKITSQAQIDQLVVNAVAGNKFSATSLGMQSNHTLDMVNRLAASGRFEAGDHNRLIENANMAMDTPKIRNDIDPDSTGRKLDILRGRHV